MIVWAAFAAIAAVIAVRACLVYNDFAGTDKTPLHVAAIAIGVMAGPCVGPFANSGTLGIPPRVMAWTVVLLLVLGLSLAPFVVVTRHVPPLCRGLAWCGYVAACSAWFGSAILSLGIFLD